MKRIVQHHYLAVMHFDPPRIIVYNMESIYNYMPYHGLKLGFSLLLHDCGPDPCLNDDAGLRFSPKGWGMLFAFGCAHN